MISKKTLGLVALPILSVGIYIYILGLNIPFWDQWSIVSYMMLKYQGHLTLEALLALHNEHRPFFPRLAWLILGSLTNYNVKAELWTNLCIVLGTFIFFVRRALRAWKENGLQPPQYIIPLMSLLIFNLSQRESWLLGFCLQYFLGMAFVVVGIFLLTERTLYSFIVAILLGIAANYSMTNGIFFWVIGLVLLLLNEAHTARIVKSVVWVVISAFSIVFFFNGWQTPFEINPLYLLTDPFEWAAWILNFLGAPIFAFWYIAWAFGVLSLFFYVVIAIQAYKKGLWKDMLPYFGLALFVMATAFSISLGRMDFGLRQSTVSRYLTMTTWYWASLLTLLPFIQIKRLRMGYIYLLLTCSLFALTIAGGWVGYVRMYLRIMPAYQSVISGQPISAEDIAQIHFNPSIAQPQIDFLRENRLSAWGQLGLP